MFVNNIIYLTKKKNTRLALKVIERSAINATRYIRFVSRNLHLTRMFRVM